MAKREIVSRYKGSIAGLLWSFLNPLLMLAVYTFVFSIIFQSKWSGGNGSRTEFALVLFAGLIIFGLFSEVISRAPVLIIGNINYVKKIIFPIEILPYIALASAFFQFMVSTFVWIIFYIIFFGVPHASIFFVANYSFAIDIAHFGDLVDSCIIRCLHSRYAAVCCNHNHDTYVSISYFLFDDFNSR